MHLGLVCDLRSHYLAAGYSEEDVAEFDSEATIAALEAALIMSGHSVECIGTGRDLAQRLGAGARWDLVFNIAEGLRGRSREAQVPALLELYGQPYTFSDPLVCAAAMDKAVAKRLMFACQVPTPHFALVREAADLNAVDLRFPLFVKPVAEGTSKGIDGQSRVANAVELRRVALTLLERLGQPVLVEEYLPGREFTTGILGSGREARVLGTLEIELLPNAPDGDYTYAVKEQCESCVVYKSPPAGALRSAVERLALDAYRAMECRDVGRVDIRLDTAGNPAFIEINPLPGLHPTHSDLPMIAAAEGLAYTDLIGSIVSSAAGRVPGDGSIPSRKVA